ncbi:hypothetical protein U0070_023769 [Myodes glareolus]|uniref:G-protein coupled receptors family 1 profile domain-containing protein n=1 Tax=Myodes glareolus TaxID=447135 RepID=A0AAW0HPJ7_MYOGA
MVSGFILVGILDDSGSPELLCGTFTALYMLAMASNGLLLLVITKDVRLHMPMYLLLWQLSLMDLLLTSVITPKAVVDFLLKDNTISFGGCALQMFLELTLGGAEDLLLAFMAYDRQQQKHGNLSATPKNSQKTDRKIEQLVHFIQGDEPTVSSNSPQDSQYRPSDPTAVPDNIYQIDECLQKII